MASGSRTVWPTSLGWSFVAVTLALALIAFTTGANLLYLLLSMMLSVLLCAVVLSELSMRRLVIRQMLPRRVFAGTPVPLRVAIQNAKRRIPAYTLAVHQPTPTKGPAVGEYVLKLPAGRSALLTHSLTMQRRGWHRLRGVCVSSRFPFGLFTNTWHPRLEHPVLVFPAVRPVTPPRGPALGAARRLNREGTRRGQSAGFHSLRRYRDGDDRRLIHWKTSARVGTLMLKELEDEDRPKISLVVEDPAPGTSAALIEANISLAASMAVDAIHRGWEVQLVLADGLTDTGSDEAHLDRILERLALYEVPARPRRLASSGATGEIRVRLDAPLTSA